MRQSGRLALHPHLCVTVHFTPFNHATLSLASAAPLANTGWATLDQRCVAPTTTLAVKSLRVGYMGCLVSFFLSLYHSRSLVAPSIHEFLYFQIKDHRTGDPLFCTWNAAHATRPLSHERLSPAANRQKNKL